MNWGLMLLSRERNNQETSNRKKEVMKKEFNGTSLTVKAPVVTMNTCNLTKPCSSPPIQMRKYNPSPKKPPNTGLWYQPSESIPPKHCIVPCFLHMKTYKHVWTPSGYVSPATALWRHSRVDMVREQVKEWGLKITRGGPVWVKAEGGGKTVYV